MTFDIKDYIKNKRPSLGASSITTYSSILRSLYKKVFGDGEIDPAKYEDTKSILKALDGLAPNKRKTILSALVIITDNKDYRDLMLSDVREYNKEISLQQKSDTQKENWVEGGDIKSVFDDCRRNAEALFKKNSLTPADLQTIQSYIIMALLGGQFVSPRRSKDFCDFKIKGVDKEKDNYLEKGELHFNSYKTAKTYGKQIVEIPKELKSILTKWMKFNPTDNLLFDTNMNPLNSVKINQRLGKIFKSIATGTSVNALRHSYLTTKYGDTIKKAKEIDKDMSEMGSSKNMLTTYVKHIDK
jgi:integrase